MRVDGKDLAKLGKLDHHGGRFFPETSEPSVRLRNWRGSAEPEDRNSYMGT